MEPIVIAILIFLGVGMFLFGGVQARQQGQERVVLKGRLAGKIETVSPGSEENADKPEILRDVNFSQIPLLNRLVGKRAFAGMLRLWLLQARLTVSPGVLILGSLTIGAFGFYAVQIALGRILPAAGVGLFLASLPLLYVRRRRRKRFLLFAQQLPDALTMMKNSLRAGHTLDRAMQVVAEEMPDPLALEFGETVEELHLGVPVKVAIQNLSTRVIDDSLNIFAAALLVQREVGGNLSSLLGNLSETIRDRFRVDQEVRSLTAEGRYSGYVVGALPVALGAVIHLIQPNYLDPLLFTPEGHGLLKTALVLEGLGFFFIQKASKVNF
jgi:tight adherence protein B